jgi:uncharacterized iron-regulated protein
MKMLIRLILIWLVLPAQILFSQHKPAYQLYTQDGQNLSYQGLLDSLATADVVLFGELHNSAVAHWLQLEITKSLYEAELNLVLGAEMFEANQQDVLEAYLADSITNQDLHNRIKLWPNFKTDYKPLLDYAQQENIAFIATNIPRPLANQVYKNGGFKALDSLSQEELKWVAPQPILFNPELPSYKRMLDMMGDHGTIDLVKAQAIKDATMAYFIRKNSQPNRLVLHFNGSYHSNYFEGIYWYLKQHQPDLNILTISLVEQAEVNTLLSEHSDLANFIICVDQDFTKTY